MAECLALALNVRVSLRPSGTLDLLDLLDRGELDLAIATLNPPPGRFASPRES
jgi:DNA-binding transcriptional LysR family regulator